MERREEAWIGSASVYVNPVSSKVGSGFIVEDRPYDFLGKNSLKSLSVDLGVKKHRGFSFVLKGDFFVFPRVKSPKSVFDQIKPRLIDWAVDVGLCPDNPTSKDSLSKKADYADVFLNSIESTSSSVLEIMPRFMLMIGFFDDVAELYVRGRIENHKVGNGASLRIMRSAIEDFSSCFSPNYFESPSRALIRSYPFYLEMRKAIFSIRQDIIKHFGSERVCEFSSFWKDYTASLILEYELSRVTRLYPKGLYYFKRKGSGGIDLVIDLALLLNGISLSGFSRLDSMKLSRLKDLSNQIVAQFNDFISFCKEISEPSFLETDNEITVEFYDLILEKNQTRSEFMKTAPSRAIKNLVLSHNKNIAEFILLMKTLDITKDKIARVCGIFRNIIRDNVDVSLRASRYLNYLPKVPYVTERKAELDRYYPEFLFDDAKNSLEQTNDFSFLKGAKL